MEIQSFTLANSSKTDMDLFVSPRRLKSKMVAMAIKQKKTCFGCSWNCQMGEGRRLWGQVGVVPANQHHSWNYSCFFPLFSLMRNGPNQWESNRHCEKDRGTPDQSGLREKANKNTLRILKAGLKSAWFTLHFCVFNSLFCVFFTLTIFIFVYLFALLN